MTFDPASVIQGLGVTGFAIYVIWKQSERKDTELLREIDKRDERNEKQQKAFVEYTTKTHESMTKQISENTKALSSNTVAFQENTKALQHFAEHLKAPSTPVFIQNKIDGQASSNQTKNE